MQTAESLFSMQCTCETRKYIGTVYDSSWAGGLCTDTLLTRSFAVARAHAAPHVSASVRHRTTLARVVRTLAVAATVANSRGDGRRASATERRRQVRARHRCCSVTRAPAAESPVLDFCHLYSNTTTDCRGVNGSLGPDEPPLLARPITA